MAAENPGGSVGMDLECGVSTVLLDGSNMVLLVPVDDSRQIMTICTLTWVTVIKGYHPKTWTNLVPL